MGLLFSQGEFAPGEAVHLTLEVAGRPATSGFCTIWVEPVEKRRFRD
jgi:hypothetical protein